MADEITTRGSLELINGGYKLKVDLGTLKFDQTGTGGRDVVVNVGTSAETIASDEIGTLGWCLLLNLDATNYVTYGPDSTGQVDFGRLEAGEFALFRLEPGITLKATANTAACEVRCIILED